MSRNIALFPWFQFARNLTFWQGTWFLYFQAELSAADAILLYAVYDIATTVLEVPSGAMSDRLGRRPTLILSTLAAILSAGLLALGGDFWVFVAGQVLLGAAMALASGTDSALLYESLEHEGRGAEVEAQELNAWRASYAALVLAAISGGALSLLGLGLPYVATAVAAAVTAGIAFAFVETRQEATATATRPSQVDAIRHALSQPVLVWLFVLGLAMYGFSHIPFVFGQPVIQQALGEHGLSAQAPMVSSVIAAAMMLLSVSVSWIGPYLRQTLGLAWLLLLAFGIQVGLVAALGLSNDVIVLALLLLRMVPDALSKAFIIARVQPLLQDEGRATFLSIKSFAGRLLLAGSLLVVSAAFGSTETLGFAEISVVLGLYATVGLVTWLSLAATARRAGVERLTPRQHRLP